MNARDFLKMNPRFKRREIIVTNHKHQRHRHKMAPSESTLSRTRARTRTRTSTTYQRNTRNILRVEQNQVSESDQMWFNRNNYNVKSIPKITMLIVVIFASSLLCNFEKSQASKFGAHQSPSSHANPSQNHYLKNAYFNFVAEPHQQQQRQQQQHPLISSKSLQQQQQQHQIESLQASSAALTSGPSPPEVETFYIRKGANGTLPCLAVSSADGSDVMNKIEWHKEDKLMAVIEDKRVVVWTTKNSIAYLPETGALLFRGVTNEDSGEYTCSLTRSKAADLVQGVVRFYVQDVPDPPQMPIITGFTQRSVSLSWVPGLDFHYSPILNYVIHVRDRDRPASSWDVENGIMTPDNKTQYEIINLKPFTTYSFRVLAVNAIGISEPSPESHPIITLRQKPDSRVDIISARNVSYNAIKLEWLPPLKKEMHGEFLGFRIKYVHQLPEPTAAPISANLNDTSDDSEATTPSSSIFSRFGVGSSSTASNKHWPSTPNNNARYHQHVEQPSLSGPLAKEIIVGDPTQTSFVIKNLNIFTLYKISVQVMNPAGDGPVAEVQAMTDEFVASAPIDVKVIKTTDTSVKLRWSEPRSPNGMLLGYVITLLDVSKDQNETRRLANPQASMEYTFGDLQALTWYTLTIQAYSRKHIGEPSQSMKFRTDVSAPSAPHSVNVTCYSPESILIQWLRPEKFFDRIDFYYVLYKTDSAADYTEASVSAKKDALLSELLITELTPNLHYELKVIAGTKSHHEPNLVYKSEQSPTLRVILQANCESYTAYPLTESPFNTSLALGVVCASFALALVTGSLIVWRRHCQAAYYYLDDPQSCSRGTNSPQLSETYDDSEYGSIGVGEWAKHVSKLHADGDIGFSREFEIVQQAKSPLLTSDHSQLPENKYKNRYINIVAYDHTRVTLRTLPNQKHKPGADYINANFIDGYNKSRAYIGTQGPLVSTFDDYWRMIWEQRVVIIVMITNLQERGRRKCDMYWPKEGTETYGNIQVKLLQEVVMATYTLRTFTAKNLKLKKRSADSERTVYQYHYTNWPDHGVPDHPLPVLSFVRKSTSANPPSGGPIICHCSAGCGRSGTYIVIDAMLKQIRHRRSINVIDFLKHIRLQRNFLVQTEEQFIFIHDSLVEAIESGETEIASNFIAKYIQLLQTGSACALPASASQQQFNAIAIQQQQQAHKNSNYSLSNALCPAPQPNGQVAPPVLVGSNHSLGSTGLDACGVSNPNYHQQHSIITTANQNISPSTTTATVNNTHTNTTQRSQSAAGGQWSLLERQYRLVASFKAKDFNVVSALKPCNKHKNRTLNLIPLEAHRVHITAKPSQEGNDYINATFLMGFNHLREFIVTQHPVYETFSDFWQMVYDHNSQTIVLLTQMNDLIKEFPQFWPQKEDEVDYGSFKVKLTQESTIVKGDSAGGAQITLRDFIMRSNQDDYELQTRVIHCPGWPESCSPLSGVFDLIHIVQNATQQQASQQRLHDGHSKSPTVTIGQEHEPQNGGPIIVVDRFGGTEAATFAVLTTLFKQINFEDAVDVYMYAKLAHLRRPGIWTSQDDYLFLYRAIENYATRLAAQQQQAAAQSSLAPLGGDAGSLAHSLLNATNPTQASLMTMTLDRHHHSRKSAASAHKERNATLKTSTMRRPKATDSASVAQKSTLFSTPIGKETIKQQQSLTSNSNTNNILQNNIKQVPNQNLKYQQQHHQHHNHNQDQSHLIAQNHNRAKSPQLAQQQQHAAATMGHIVTSQLAHPLEQQSHQQQFLQQYQQLQHQQQQQLLFKQQLQQQLNQRQILASQQQQQNHYQNQNELKQTMTKVNNNNSNTNNNNNILQQNHNNNKGNKNDNDATGNTASSTLRVK